LAMNLKQFPLIYRTFGAGFARITKKRRGYVRGEAEKYLDKRMVKMLNVHLSSQEFIYFGLKYETIMRRMVKIKDKHRVPLRRKRRNEKYNLLFSEEN